MSTTSTSPALWTLGFAALVLSGFSLWSSLAKPGNPPETDLTQEGIEADLKEGFAKIEESQGLLLARIESLNLRVKGLEDSRERTRILLSAKTDEDEASKARSADTKLEAVDANARPPIKKKEFAALLEKMFRMGNEGQASTEEQERFWKLARTTTMIDDLIKDLRSAVETSPGSAEKRLQLADAYVAKLLTVPDGPERAIYGIQAESQWKKILKTDPTHWESQFSLAFSRSQYPDFMNMTGDAIKKYEKVLKIQERRPQENRFAQTYPQLAQLYKKQGKIDKALAMLREGNRRFPKDANIRKLLDELQGR